MQEKTFCREEAVWNSLALDFCHTNAYVILAYTFPQSHVLCCRRFCLDYKYSNPLPGIPNSLYSFGIFSIPRPSSPHSPDFSWTAL